jgi:hypothetical protein
VKIAVVDQVREHQGLDQPAVHRPGAVGPLGDAEAPGVQADNGRGDGLGDRPRRPAMSGNSAAAQPTCMFITKPPTFLLTEV